MTIAAILAGVPAAPFPGLWPGGQFPSLLPGTPMPADGFAGLLAAALPMLPTLVAPITAAVLPPAPLVNAPASNGDGIVMPAGTTMPIVEALADATGSVVAAPAPLLAPVLARPAAPTLARLPAHPATLAPEGAALAPVGPNPVAARVRGGAKLPPPPEGIGAEALAAPVAALASIDPAPVETPVQAVPVLRPAPSAPAAPAVDTGDDRGAIRQKAVVDGAPSPVLERPSSQGARAGANLTQVALAPRLAGAGAAPPVDAGPAPIVPRVGQQPMIRPASVAADPVPVAVAAVATVTIGASRSDAAEAVAAAIPTTIPPAGLRHARLAPAAPDDPARVAAIGMAGAPGPAVPPILLPAIAPSLQGEAPPEPHIAATVLPASPTRLATMPAARGDGAHNLAGAAWMPPVLQSPVAPAGVLASRIPQDGGALAILDDGRAPPAQRVVPLPAAVFPVAPIVDVAVPAIVDGVDNLAVDAASTPRQPVMTQVPPVAGMAAPSEDSAPAVVARSPGAGAVPTRADKQVSALAGADRAVAGAMVSQVVAPARPAQSGNDDRRDVRDRPIRGRAVAAGSLAPVAQPLPAAFAPPMVAERAAVPAAPLASIPGASAPDRAATAMTVTTEQLGAVGIGVDDDAGQLRVRLSGSALAMDTLSAQAPRLVAELAATGVRLGSLDIAGRADTAQVPAGSVAASALAGDATSDQRTASGQAGADAFTGGGADARGRPSADRRARSAAGIAALARGGIAGDPLAARRFSPSDRYA